MYKILLVHSLFPTTYWGFQDALKLVNKKASLPPLGMITLAACLPKGWKLRLVDLNVTALEDEDILWADAVFVGGMFVQADSMQAVVARAHELNRPVVVGGPSATTTPEIFPDADVVFQGEAESNIDALVAAVDKLHTERSEQRRKQVVIPPADEYPDLTTVPVPRYDLLDMAQYSSMAVQYSRGCPFKCEFCDIIEMFGRVCRVKSSSQILAELSEILRLQFQGSVFLVDDNFIGNKREVKKLLPEIIDWQKRNRRPFDFYTEASMNLASDPGLMKLMVEAGIRAVFAGIETPSKEALKGAGKGQNLRSSLTDAVDIMTRAGLEVMGGFIVGFDQDGPEIFEAQRQFIQSNPIPLAMVGVLAALPGTALWRRLEKEGRLRGCPDGDQFGRANFVPTMDEETLLRGYRKLMRDLYSAKAYYRRCEAYVERSGRIPESGWEGSGDIKYLFKTVVKVGIESPRRFRFWRLLGKTLFAAPHTFKWAVIHALQGEHMIRYTEEHVLPRLDRAIAEVVTERQLAKASPAPPIPAAQDSLEVPAQSQSLRKRHR